MGENEYTGYDEGREIDLLDMLFYLMKRWRALVVAVIIGAVIGGGIYMLKKSEQDKQVQQKAEISTETPEKAAAEYDISDETKTSMDIAYAYREYYESQLEYSRTSVIMQLDPYKLDTGILKYRISAGYDTGLISTRYQDIMNDDAAMEKLIEASGLDCGVEDIRELLGCSTTEESTSPIYVNGSEDELSVVKNTFVTYTVVSTSESSCEAMLGALDECVAALNEELTKEYDSYTYDRISSQVKQVINSDYLSRQKSVMDALNSYLSTMKQYEDAFSDEEKEYYNAVYLSQGRADAAEDSESAEAAAPVTTPAENAPVSPAKWLVIGIALCVLLWGMFYVIKYLFDKHIKTPHEVRSSYGLPVIGRISMNSEPAKGLDGLLDRLHSRGQNRPDTMDYLTQAINSMQHEALALCGNAEEEGVKKLMDELAGSCKCLTACDMVGRSEKALQTAKTAGKAVLVVSLGATKRIELERELDTCRLQKIEVAGAVVVE